MDVKPTLKRENGKLIAEASLELDLDRDQVPSAIAKIVVEVNEGEMTEEALGEVMKSVKLPDWVAGMLGVKKA